MAAPLIKTAADHINDKYSYNQSSRQPRKKSPYPKNDGMSKSEYYIKHRDLINNIIDQYENITSLSRSQEEKFKRDIKWIKESIEFKNDADIEVELNLLFIKQEYLWYELLNRHKVEYLISQIDEKELNDLNSFYCPEENISTLLNTIPNDSDRYPELSIVKSYNKLLKKKKKLKQQTTEIDNITKTKYSSSTDTYRLGNARAKIVSCLQNFRDVEQFRPNKYDKLVRAHNDIDAIISSKVQFTLDREINSNNLHEWVKNLTDLERLFRDNVKYWDPIVKIKHQFNLMITHKNKFACFPDIRMIQTIKDGTVKEDLHMKLRIIYKQLDKDFIKSLDPTDSSELKDQLTTLICNNLRKAKIVGKTRKKLKMDIPSTSMVKIMNAHIYNCEFIPYKSITLQVMKLRELFEIPDTICYSKKLSEIQ